jgi:hypothetical protein
MATTPTMVPAPPGLVFSPHWSDVIIPFRQHNCVNICGVLHCYDNTIDRQLHIWVEHIRVWAAATARFRRQGFNVFQFTEFSSPDKWFTSHSSQNMDITERLTVADFTEAEILQAASVSHDGHSNAADDLERLRRENQDMHAALERVREC